MSSRLQPIARESGWNTYAGVRSLEKRIYALEQRSAANILSIDVTGNEIQRVTSLSSITTVAGVPQFAVLDRGSGKGDVLYAWGKNSSGVWVWLQVVKWPSVV